MVRFKKCTAYFKRFHRVMADYSLMLPKIAFRY